MTIISKTIGSVGQIGVTPRRIQMVVTDALSVVTTANYLQADHLLPDTIYPTDIVDMYYGATNLNAPGTYGEFLVSITAGVITLVQAEGSVALPTIVGHIAVYNSVSGGLGEDAATAINGGNIQAGLSGTAGTLASFPATAANGSLRVVGVNAGGAFNTTISNSTMGQSTVYSLPDIGATTGGIVVSTTAIRTKTVAAAAAAGGAAAQSFTDAFCTSSSVVLGNWVTQATPASVLTIVPGTGSFVVTSSANAGVGTFSYQISK